MEQEHEETPSPQASGKDKDTAPDGRAVSHAGTDGSAGSALLAAAASAASLRAFLASRSALLARAFSSASTFFFRTLSSTSGERPAESGPTWVRPRHRCR
ncbi:unnamed protein product [Prorocentrum cordatum]|uniref:Uncharacterized protein n=1 Tax=Prorocentrum cordatum TaxID=2364126 RepID=A0ABN9WI56_9DINO|nr:unnamed protein product [Polarella glacialis]